MALVCRAVIHFFWDTENFKIRGDRFVRLFGGVAGGVTEKTREDSSSSDCARAVRAAEGHATRCDDEYRGNERVGKTEKRAWPILRNILSHRVSSSRYKNLSDDKTRTCTVRAVHGTVCHTFRQRVSTESDARPRPYRSSPPHSPILFRFRRSRQKITRRSQVRHRGRVDRGVDVPRIRDVASERGEGAFQVRGLRLAD